MREGVLINQKEEDIEQKLMNFSMGGRDASDFTKWQQEMKKVILKILVQVVFKQKSIAFNTAKLGPST